VGAVTFTGPGTIQNGTLQGVSYTNNATSGTEIVNAVLAGTGRTVTQSGAGSTLVLEGANTYSGGTTISAGTLESANAQALGLGAGANVALSGSGTLETNNVNHALTVGGTYNQTGGDLTININASPNAAGNNAANDLLSVNSTATINGGTLTVDFGSFRPTKGDIYEVIASNTGGGTNGIQGTVFTTTVQNPAAYQIAVSTTAIPADTSGNHLYIDITSVEFALTGQLGGFATPNRVSVLDYIDNNVISGPLFNVITAALGGGDLPATAADVADQFNPAKFANFANTTVVNNAVFSTQLLDDYLASGRTPNGDFAQSSGGIDSSGLTVVDPSMDPGLASVGSRLLAWSPAPLAHGLLSDSSNPVLAGTDMKAMTATTPGPTTGNNFSTFVAGQVVLAQTYSQPDLGLDHSDQTTGGVQIGADYRFTPHLRVGAMFSYNHTDADLDNNGSKATLDSYAPGVYLSYAQAGWYANALINYGFDNFTEDRHIGLGGFSAVAHGAPSGDQATGNLDGGYDFHLNNWTFGPLLGVQYTHLDVNSYTEDGAESLAADESVASQQADSVRSRLGGHASYDFHTGKVVLTPHLDASWQHEFLDNADGIDAVIVSPATAGAPPFSVRTQDPSRESALLDCGLNAQLCGQVSVFGDYLVQVGQSDYFGQSVQAGVKIGF
jgi:autotransporter-associated beta strand protein